jgi:hypothetical protein
MIAIDFLFDNFELLFSKDVVTDEQKRLEEKLSIVEGIENFNDIKSKLPQITPGIEVLKIEFDKLREDIKHPKQDNSFYLGGGVKSLVFIKQYIINKIQHIVPKD